MAEVMKFDDFKEHGSEAAAKVKCWARIQASFISVMIVSDFGCS